MSQMQFEFDPIKLGQALAYLSARVSDLTKMKAAKLLYFADKQHLVRYGRPIIGDRYYCLDYGPVPSASLNAINDLISHVRIRIGGKDIRGGMSDVLGEFVRVKRLGNHPTLVPRYADPTLDALLGVETETLDDVVKRLGKRTAAQLVALTHREKTWVTTNKKRPEGSSVEIPWELFLDDDPASVAPGVREHIAEHQESDAFLRALTKTVRR